MSAVADTTSRTKSPIPAASLPSQNPSFQSTTPPFPRSDTYAEESSEYLNGGRDQDVCPPGAYPSDVLEERADAAPHGTVAIPSVLTTTPTSNSKIIEYVGDTARKYLPGSVIGIMSNIIPVGVTDPNEVEQQVNATSKGKVDGEHSEGVMPRKSSQDIKNAASNKETDFSTRNSSMNDTMSTASSGIARNSGTCKSVSSSIFDGNEYFRPSFPKDMPDVPLRQRGKALRKLEDENSKERNPDGNDRNDHDANESEVKENTNTEEVSERAKYSRHNNMASDDAKRQPSYPNVKVGEKVVAGPDTSSGSPGDIASSPKDAGSKVEHDVKSISKDEIDVNASASQQFDTKDRSDSATEGDSADDGDSSMERESGEYNGDATSGQRTRVKAARKLKKGKSLVKRMKDKVRRT